MDAQAVQVAGVVAPVVMVTAAGALGTRGTVPGSAKRKRGCEEPRVSAVSLIRTRAA
jgi:hypothetical protein